MSKLNLDLKVPSQYDKATFSDIVRAICGQVNPLSEGRLAARYNAQSVVPTTGDYAVGDFVPDSNCTVTAGNIRLGWVCVAPGSPGTLKEARVIVSALAPTRTVLTTGSGTYSTPAGCTSIDIELVGGGGAGAGSGTGAGNGGDGGDTTFGTLTASKGTGGATTGAGGAAGTGTNGDLNIAGEYGGQIDGGVTNERGGIAGASFFGGAGRQPNSGNAGLAAAANSGSAGSGAGCGATVNAGGGGASGGYVRKLIAGPAASYSYAVGDGGTAGTAGTSGFAGGAGAKGIIIITEHYN